MARAATFIAETRCGSGYAGMSKGPSMKAPPLTDRGAVAASRLHTGRHKGDRVGQRFSDVVNLQHNDYSHISRPVLSGRFYQVKVVNADGQRVKLCINPCGRIAKVKG